MTTTIVRVRLTSETKEALDLLAREMDRPRTQLAARAIAEYVRRNTWQLECLLFMRSVKSAPYFEQMKGRGTRVIDRDSLRTVTPDAEVKDRFVIVDAVGVCEDDLTELQPLDRQPQISFAKILDAVAVGVANPSF